MTLDLECVKIALDAAPVDPLDLLVTNVAVDGNMFSNTMIENYCQEHPVYTNRDLSIPLSAILSSRYVESYFTFMAKTGMLKQLIPILDRCIDYDQKNPHHRWDLFRHTLRTMAYVPNTLELRLAALFHDVGKLTTRTTSDDGVGHYYGHPKESAHIAEELLPSLGYGDSNVIALVRELIYEHMNHSEDISDKGIGRLIERMSAWPGKLTTNLYYLWTLQEADIHACGIYVAEDLQKHKLFKEKVSSFLRRKEDEDDSESDPTMLDW